MKGDRYPPRPSIIKAFAGAWAAEMIARASAADAAPAAATVAAWATLAEIARTQSQGNNHCAPRAVVLNRPDVGFMVCLLRRGIGPLSAPTTHPVIGRTASCAQIGWIGRPTNTSLQPPLVGPTFSYSRPASRAAERVTLLRRDWARPGGVQPPRRRPACARRSRACSRCARGAPPRCVE